MRQLFLCLLLSLFSVGVYSQNQQLNLQGAWKVLSGTQFKDGKQTSAFLDGAIMDEVKIWSGNRVMFVSHFKKKDGESDAYGSGTWKLSGTHYEESYTISSYKKRLENKTVRLKLEMKGDTLVQTFFLNEKFEVDNNTEFVLKYIKIK